MYTPTWQCRWVKQRLFVVSWRPYHLPPTPPPPRVEPKQFWGNSSSVIHKGFVQAIVLLYWITRRQLKAFLNHYLCYIYRLLLRTEREVQQKQLLRDIERTKSVTVMDVQRNSLNFQQTFTVTPQMRKIAIVLVLARCISTKCQDFG